MRQVFADSNYWIALLNPREGLHSKAVLAARKHSADRIVTSEMVLVEFLNSFSGAGPHLRSAAADIVRSLRENPGVSIAAQTSEQFAQALRLYGERPDKSWSLTDCASFLIMDAAGIDAALTQDQHFAQAGYEVVLR